MFEKLLLSLVVRRVTAQKCVALGWVAGGGGNLGSFPLVRTVAVGLGCRRGGADLGPISLV
jgi:hypothetical protein